jgi:hypothetical protein
MPAGFRSIRPVWSSQRRLARDLMHRSGGRVGRRDPAVPEALWCVPDPRLLAVAARMARFQTAMASLRNRLHGANNTHESHPISAALRAKHTCWWLRKLLQSQQLSSLSPSSLGQLFLASHSKRLRRRSESDPGRALLGRTSEQRAVALSGSAAYFRCRKNLPWMPTLQ